MTRIERNTVGFLVGLIIAMLIGVFVPAHAGGWEERDRPPPQRDMPDNRNSNANRNENFNRNENSNNNTNINDNRSSAEQSQNQEQQQTQGQAQTQTAIGGEANNEGVTQAVNFNDRRQVHSAMAPGVQSAHACTYGGSAALGLSRINIGGGKQKIDPDCAKLETARMLGSLGEMELAIEVACATKSAIEVLGDRCGPSTTLQERIAVLEDQKAQLLALRETDRAACDESKDRIFGACLEGK